MKILTVISGLNFPDHPRRSTILAIHKVNNETDILLYNSVKNIFKKKKLAHSIRFYNYHFWMMEKTRKISFLVGMEYFLRASRWNRFFKKYDVVFFIDPNQYYLLPYLNSNHKLIYLLRDPGVLQNSLIFNQELPIISRADAVLAISENLRDNYFLKHFGFQPSQVLLWSNAVDLDVWNLKKYSVIARKKDMKIAGMAGNINQRTDLDLLKYLLENCKDINFEIAGKVNLKDSEMILKWENLFKYDNFNYLGYFPFEELPSVVAGWDIGLLIESKDSEYATYFNQNKIYQYLALGKSFVSYNYNDYFDSFHSIAYIASDRKEYSQMVNKAIQKSENLQLQSECLKVAKANSTEKRAFEFFEILKKIK